MFRNRISTVCLALMVTTIAFSCKSTAALKEQVRTIPYKRLENYSFDPAAVLIDRVEKVPDIVLSYYREMDERPSYTPYVPSQGEMREIERCLSMLPSVHKQVLENKLLGIYFIEN